MTWQDLDDIPALLVYLTRSGPPWPASMMDRALIALTHLRMKVNRALRDDEYLTIYRAVNVAEVRRIQWHNIGCCWTHQEDSAHAYHGSHGVHQHLLRGADPVRVRLTGRVKLNDVDWRKTFDLNCDNPQEHEIRLAQGAVVDITGGTYFDLVRRAWTPLNIRRSFRARVDPDDRFDSWQMRRFWPPKPPRQK